MPARIARSVTTSNSRYICLSCRLQNSTLPRGQIARSQHTGSPANQGTDSTQGFVSKNGENYNDSASPSRIGDILRSFMSKQNEKHKANKGKSGNENQKKTEQTSPIASTPVTVPTPKEHTNVVQQKLQEKFAAKRRQDMLAMQVSKDPRADDAIPPMPESIKQKPKKSVSRAERKQQRKIEKAAALREKPMKRSKKTEAKPIKSRQKGTVRIVTSKRRGRAEESPKNIIIPNANPQETQGAKLMAFNEGDSENVPREQSTPLQKLDKINGFLDPQQNSKTSGDLANDAQGIETSLRNAATKIFQELLSKRASLDMDSPEAGAIIQQYSSLLAECFKQNSGKNIESLVQLKMQSVLKGQLGKIKDSPVIDTVDNNHQNSSAPVNLRKHAAIEKVRRPLLKPEFAQPLSIKPIEKARVPAKAPPKSTQKTKSSPGTPIEKANASDLELLPVMVDQPPVPRLAYGLERVLFNPGVYELQDSRSRVYNFDPYLQKIMPVAEFDFNALKEYITSSRDESLNRIAQESGKRYMGSTSSMTGVLAHFHFLLSQWRPLDISMLSKSFPRDLQSFTEFQRIPSAIFLRWKDGSYAIDADKEFASANVLSMLGKSMEKLLTLDTNDFERYRKSSPGRVTEEERSAPESYHYSTMGEFLMRSQLDAYDPRLPGTGMFDLKTRSVVSIRMDVANYEHGVGYELRSRRGEWESYEREYYDMIRSAFLKYSLQVRMGRMDGIFVAFHNIERIFGFQYISLPEMDSTLHGQSDTSIGDQEFRLSLDLLNKVLDRAAKKYPESSLRIFFETRDTQTPFMYIFVEPVTEEQVAEIQSQNNAKIQEFERSVLGLTRGDSFGADDAQEVDPKWEEIQADVQKAMESDEISVDGPSHNRAAIDVDSELIESAINRPDVPVQDPSFASQSVSSADSHAIAAPTGNEEDDAQGENKDDIDEVEEGHEYRDATASEEVAESGRQEGLEEFIESKADTNAMDAVEAEQEVGGDGLAYAAPSEGYPFLSLKDALSEGFDEDGTFKGTSEREFYSSAEGEAEDQEGDHTQADQTFLDSIIQEVDEADNTDDSSTSGDILAMTLTLRNKVNGNYVFRPEKMTASDEWSIEYSLTEVSDQTRARALYKACQRRRSKKEETSMAEDAGTVSAFVSHLRKLSAKGREWREQQDVGDLKQPVQVLGAKGPERVV